MTGQAYMVSGASGTNKTIRYVRCLVPVEKECLAEGDVGHPGLLSLAKFFVEARINDSFFLLVNTLWACMLILRGHDNCWLAAG